MTSEELGGREWLLAWHLEDQDADGPLGGGDDQSIAFGLDDLAGSALAVDDGGLVDDDPGRDPGITGPVAPGRGSNRPGLHGADEVMDGLGGAGPIDLPVLLAELGSLGDPGLVLRQDPDGPRGEGIEGLSDQGAPRRARRASSSPDVSSLSISVRAMAIMPPASIRGVIRMTVTPVDVSPFWMARATGAAPRYDGKTEPCRLIPPSEGMERRSAERIWPYAAVTSKSGFNVRTRSRLAGALTSSGCSTGIPRAWAASLIRLGISSCLRPWGRSGWVINVTT